MRKNYFSGHMVKKILPIIFIASIISSGLTIFFSWGLMQSLDLVKFEQDKRLESILIADELRQSSDDLTNFARMYVETGNTDYKYYYQEVIDIRNGDSPRPQGYENVYWDLKIIKGDTIPGPGGIIENTHGDRISLKERMIKLGFSKKEFELLELSKSLSDELVIIENEAFSIIEGKSPSSLDVINEGKDSSRINVISIDPISGELCYKKIFLYEERNNIYAKSLLFNQNYLNAKYRIMEPIGDFRAEVEKRTKRSLKGVEDQAHKYMIYTVILSIISLCFLINLAIAIYKTNHSNENLLFSLNKKNTYLEHAAKILRHDMHSGINVYIPRGLKSLERRLTDDQITNLKIESPMKMIREGLKHTQRVYSGVYEFTNLVKKEAVMQKEKLNTKLILREYLKSTSYGSQVLLDDNLPTIEVNQSLFCTAIDNLIRNGLKYNDSDNKTIKIYKEDSFICVQDNGRGVSQEEFKKLSEPYTRREDQKESGMGLGLNICNSILEEHNFSISVEKLDRGTKIKIKVI